ncbi:MAG: hypothetical protein HY051_02675 [Candidatus Aenigmarchaeota archaeon]|nr:hypothetical protein [Candidatus Aenigmarchaeota archaeon]
MAVRKGAGRRELCNCNLGLMLVAKAVSSVGVFILVAGLGAQLAVGLTGQNSLPLYASVLPLYFVGFVVKELGKIVGMESHRKCGLHGHMC